MNLATPKAATVSVDEFFVISSLSPGPTQKRLAVAFVLGILVVAIIVVAELSGVHVGRIDAFVPAYLTAMFVLDSITAVLLFAQFSVVRFRALLVIASGYLFTALVLIPYALTFPGLLAPEGFLGGLQSSAGIYMLWHQGFPLFVIVYALLIDPNGTKEIRQTKPSTAIAISVVSTATIVSIGAIFCILAEPLLPEIMLSPTHFGPVWPYYVGAPIALLCVIALIALWIRRRSILDLWLMVVMCLYLVEVPLSYYPAPTRFSAGWYTVRVIAFIASGLILTVLLHEITTLYARLLRSIHAQRLDRQARLVTGDAIAATIAHEVRQPLSAMITSADAGLRFLNRSEPDSLEARDAFKQISADGHRAKAVVENVRANFRNEARAMVSLDVNDLIEEAVSLVQEDLQVHRIQLKSDSNAQLPPVRGNPIQLQQVLLNLITNAIDSMASKNGHRILSVKSGLRDDGSIVISVADTGTGIASQDIDQVFNPLFTTKSGGMGMGLSICRSIINAHDGHLSVAPNASGGTVFQFALQRAS